MGVDGNELIADDPHPLRGPTQRGAAAASVRDCDTTPVDALVMMDQKPGADS